MSAIVLNWTAAKWKAGPRVERYQILREGESGFVLVGTVHLEYSFLMELLGPPLTFTDNNVEEGVTYRYKVLAIASNGRSLRSNVITITSPAVPPEGLLQEDLFAVLQEDLSFILIEESDEVLGLLKETGEAILQETDDFILLDEPAGTPPVLTEVNGHDDHSDLVWEAAVVPDGTVFGYDIYRVTAIEYGGTPGFQVNPEDLGSGDPSYYDTAGDVLTYEDIGAPNIFGEQCAYMIVADTSNGLLYSNIMFSQGLS